MANILELARTIASGVYNDATFQEASTLSPDEIRQLSVAMMQQAAQFSTDAKVAGDKLLNHPDAYPVRQNAIIFVLEATENMPLTTEASQHWALKAAEYARRWEESHNLARLQITDDREKMSDDFSNIGGREHDFVAMPIAFAAGILRKFSDMDVFPSARGPLAYEQTYWLTLGGKFDEAKAANLQHAAACEEASDWMGGAVFRMQAAKCGLDGNLEGAGAFLLETYEHVLPVLQENRSSQLAQAWMKAGGTMEGHMAQALGLDAELAPRVQAFKEDLTLARQGTYTPPDIGGM